VYLPGFRIGYDAGMSGLGSHSLSWTLLAGLALGCGNGGGGGDEGGSETSSATEVDDVTGPPTTGPGTTSTDPDDVTTEDPDTATTEPLPECGNGVREDPEQCDDGNLEPGDGCDPDCTETVDTQLWEDVQGGAAAVQESGQGVVVDGAGNIVVVGYLVDDVGNPDIWVKKYDPAGAEVWTQVLDPSMGFDDRGHGVDVDAQDNILVSGDIGVSETASDVWLGKLDPAGALVWQYTFDGPEGQNDIGEDVAVDADGNAVVAGSVRVAPNDVDIFYAKVDPAGAELWSTIVAGPATYEDRAMGVEIDGDGNAVVAGFVSADAFALDVWLRKVDPAGAEVWTTTWESLQGGVDQGFDVAIAPDGSIGVAGTTPIIATNENVWLGKFDADGMLVWYQDFGGPAILNDHGLGIAADSQGAFVVVGFKGVADTDSDIWLRKWDAAGNVVWTQSIIGAGMDRDQALAAAVDANDDVVATGEIRQRANNNGDIWVAKFAGSR